MRIKSAFLLLLSSVWIIIPSCSNNKSVAIPFWEEKDDGVVKVKKQVPVEDFDLIEGYTIDPGFDVVSIRVENDEQQTKFDLSNLGLLNGFDGLDGYLDEVTDVDYPMPGRALIQFHSGANVYLVYYKPAGLKQHTAYGLSANRDVLNQYVAENKDNAQFRDYSEFEVALTIAIKLLGEKQFKNYHSFCSFESESGLTTRSAVVAKVK